MGDQRRKIDGAEIIEQIKVITGSMERALEDRRRIGLGHICDHYGFEVKAITNGLSRLKINPDKAKRTVAHAYAIAGERLRDEGLWVRKDFDPIPEDSTPDQVISAAMAADEPAPSVQSKVNSAATEPVFNVDAAMERAQKNAHCRERLGSDGLEPVFSLNTETTSDQLPPFERGSAASLRLAGSGRYDVVIIRGVASGDLAAVLRSIDRGSCK